MKDSPNTQVTMAPKKAQGGFKLNSRLTDKDELTFQGDLYHTTFNQRINLYTFQPPYNKISNDSGENGGWNITSLWRHKTSSTGEFSLQVYYGHSQRPDFLTGQRFDALDIDFQYNFELARHTTWTFGCAIIARRKLWSRSTCSG